MRRLFRAACRPICWISPAVCGVLAIALLSVSGSGALAQAGSPLKQHAQAPAELKRASHPPVADVGHPGVGTLQTPQPLLPPAFAGRPREGSIEMSGSAADADPAHAAVLQEDGLKVAATAQYRGVGVVSWRVQLLHFGDATGALSAFTFYRQPGMQAEQAGDNAAADATTFLVQRDANVVMVQAGDANSGSPAGDATHLRSAVESLLAGLPKTQGPEAVLPALPRLLPSQNLVATTMHYAIGPASYEGAIPVGAIDFSRDAEAATAQYRFASGSSGVLTLIMLPTPQIAHAQEQAIARLPNPQVHLAARRIGPLLGVVSGVGVSAAEAQGLVGAIRYKPEVTLDEETPQGPTEIAKTAQLLLGIAYLTGLLAIASVVIAIFLGAGRVALRRLRGKPDSSMNDDDFISLKLK